MHISLIKVSEEFNNANGRHIWLGCDVVVNEGEDEAVAFKKAMDSIFKANELASESIPVPIIERLDSHERDEEFETLKIKLESIEFREDAQAYLDTTPFNLAYEAKKLVNNKPLKH